VPRNKRKQIEISNESLKSLLQEIYNQSCEERANAIRLRNRIERDMKGNVDINIVSKALGDANKLVQDSIQKKLIVAKMLVDIIVKTIGDTKQDKNTPVNDSSDKETLRKMINEMKHGKKNQ
jgi:hypothetical protein